MGKRRKLTTSKKSNEKGNDILQTEKCMLPQDNNPQVIQRTTRKTSRQKLESENVRTMTSSDFILLSQSDGIGEVAWADETPTYDCQDNRTPIEDLVKRFTTDGDYGTSDTPPGTPPLVNLWVDSPTQSTRINRSDEDMHKIKRKPIRKSKGRPARRPVKNMAINSKEILNKLAAVLESQKDNNMEEKTESKVDDHHNSPAETSGRFSSTQKPLSCPTDSPLETTCISPILQVKKATQAEPLKSSPQFNMKDHTSFSTPKSAFKESFVGLATPKSALKNYSGEELWTDEELFENDSFMKATQAILEVDKTPSPIVKGKRKLDTVNTGNKRSQIFQLTSPPAGNKKTSEDCANFKKPSPVGQQKSAKLIPLQKSSTSTREDKSVFKRPHAKPEVGTSTSSCSLQKLSCHLTTRSAIQTLQSNVSCNSVQVSCHNTTTKTVCAKSSSKLASNTSVSAYKSKTLANCYVSSSKVSNTTSTVTSSICNVDPMKRGTAKSGSNHVSKSVISTSKDKNVSYNFKKSDSIICPNVPKVTSPVNNRKKNSNYSEIDISISEDILATLAEPDDLLDSQIPMFDDSFLPVKDMKPELCTKPEVGPSHKSHVIPDNTIIANNSSGSSTETLCSSNQSTDSAHKNSADIMCNVKSKTVELGAGTASRNVFDRPYNSSVENATTKMDCRESEDCSTGDELAEEDLLAVLEETESHVCDSLQMTKTSRDRIPDRSAETESHKQQTSLQSNKSVACGSSSSFPKSWACANAANQKVDSRTSSKESAVKNSPNMSERADDSVSVLGNKKEMTMSSVTDQHKQCSDLNTQNNKTTNPYVLPRKNTQNCSTVSHDPNQKSSRVMNSSGKTFTAKSISSRNTSTASKPNEPSAFQKRVQQSYMQRVQQPTSGQSAAPLQTNDNGTGSIPVNYNSSNSIMFSTSMTSTPSAAQGTNTSVHQSSLASKGTKVLQKFPSFDSLNPHASPKTVVSKSFSCSQDSPNSKMTATSVKKCDPSEIERKKQEALKRRQNKLKLNKNRPK